MRTIKWSTEFKKDYRRIKAAPRHIHDVDGLLEAVVTLLVEDRPLPESCREHALVGNWKNYRECHIKPDLLLIYKTEEPGILRLARLGSIQSCSAGSRGFCAHLVTGLQFLVFCWR